MPSSLFVQQAFYNNSKQWTMVLTAADNNCIYNHHITIYTHESKAYIPPNNVWMAKGRKSAVSQSTSEWVGFKVPPDTV